jgi:hypothetical protein
MGLTYQPTNQPMNRPTSKPTNKLKGRDLPKVQVSSAVPSYEMHCWAMTWKPYNYQRINRKWQIFWDFVGK